MWTRIGGVQGKHTDHLTTTMAHTTLVVQLTYGTEMVREIFIGNPTKVWSCNKTERCFC